MGKCVASGYVPPAEITICDGCFHKDVCGDRDYLTENKCSARAGGCRCGECAHYEKGKDYTPYCNHFNGIAQANEDDFCSYGEPKEI